MKPLRGPPIKLVRVMCFLCGAAALGSTFYRALGKPGLAFGILLGGLLGQALARWIERTFLEF